MTAPRGTAARPVRIDAANESAWCGEEQLQLTPRSFAVLRQLVEHAERLITKDDLLATVWRDAIVSDAALASCIRDLRRALGDSSDAPQYIQTVHRRGFRFIGPVAGGTASVPAARPSTSGAGGLEIGYSPDVGPKNAPLVGRELELTRLRDRLNRALGGHRQLVFVTGEPGIGKTALVEAFLADIPQGQGVRVCRGQCVEQYGAGEPYLPVLEALGRLGRSSHGEQLVQVLKQQAPTWLAQLPGLLSDHDVEEVQRRAQGATRDRMLRELVEALDAVARDAPLVLLLEDLHWSDSATIDLLAMLARRREAARLLVIGTFRPADVAGAAHHLKPVKQELQVHGQCEDLPLEFLSAVAVEQYLAQRFPGHRFPAELAHVLHRNTDGNPLYLVNTIEELIRQGPLRESDSQWVLAVPVDAIALGAPDTLWQIVERQVDRLSQHEQAMLAVASVAGREFSAAVAVAGDIDREAGELCCEALARRGLFVRAAGLAEWPDGTVAGRYAFIHSLYQQVLYARVPVGDRVGLHLRTGQCLERAYGERADEIAGELAMHFEHGRDLERAARYRRHAGEHALRQHAYREAADHATRALELVRALPDSPERVEQELSALVMLGAALTATRGYAAPEVARTYARARDLCEQVGDTVRLLPVLLGLGRFHHGRGEVEMARAVGLRVLGIAEASGDGAVRLAAHNALGIIAFYAGELEAALEHADRGIAMYDPDAHSPGRAVAFRAGQDLGVSCLVYAAWTLQLLGHPTRAAARMREALALARSLEHPFSITYACHFAAGLHLYRREREGVQQLEDEALAYSTEHGFRLFPLMGAIHRGWLLAEQGREEEGLAEIRGGLGALRALGVELRMPAFLALSAEVCGKLGRPGDGLAAVGDGLALGKRTGQRYWDAELHRLEGALASQRHGTRGADGAVPSFLEAIDIARRQGAKALELRAATSLARLRAGAGRASEAHRLLSGVYGWFTEGFDTADLKDAKVLLEETAS